MHVELDIFSGRRNPCWDLHAAQADEFLKLLRQLRAAETVEPVPDGLGYRGIIVRPSRDEFPDLEEIVVCPRRDNPARRRDPPNDLRRSCRSSGG